MKALVFRPNRPPVIEEVDGFEGLRKTIGGDIERITLDWGRDGTSRMIQLWCDEDGMGRGLPENVWAEGPAYRGAPIFGTAVVCVARRTSDDEEFLDMTDDETLRWGAFLKRFVAMAGVSR